MYADLESLIAVPVAAGGSDAVAMFRSPRVWRAGVGAIAGFYPRNLGHFCPLARVVADFLSVLIFHDVAMQLNYYLLHYSAE